MSAALIESLAVYAHRHGGVLLNPDVEFSGVSTDTRTLSPQQLFVAISGQRFDGHNYCRTALDKGACGLLLERPQPELGCAQWVVPDSIQALGKVAADVRAAFTGTTVALTGSSGKTTTRGMVQCILALMGPTHATVGNFNNHIGLPLTLMRLRDTDQFSVLEMGASGVGEIAYLSAIGKPDIALVNNVGTAHLEGFGSRDNIVAGKGEIYQALSPEGTAVINLDTYGVEHLQSLASCQQLTFSLHDSSADFYADRVVLNAEGSHFLMRCPLGQLAIELRVPAIENVANALASAACAYAAGATAQAIQQGLNQFSATAGRLSEQVGLNGCRVIDDAYNANPASFAMAIGVLAAMPGETILIMGDMAELGPEAEALHASVGEQAKQAGIDRLLAVGELSRNAVDAFGAKAQWYPSKQELILHSCNLATAETSFLCKGSRGSAMDEVAAALTEPRTDHVALAH